MYISFIVFLFCFSKKKRNNRGNFRTVSSALWLFKSYGLQCRVRQCSVLKNMLHDVVTWKIMHPHDFLITWSYMMFFMNKQHCFLENSVCSQWFHGNLFIIFSSYGSHGFKFYFSVKFLRMQKNGVPVILATVRVRKHPWFLSGTNCYTLCIDYI